MINKPYLHTIIDTLLEESYNVRKNDNRGFRLSTISEVQEYGTLELGVPRRTGKTSYIIKNASKSDCIIIPTIWMKLQLYKDHIARVYTLNELEDISSQDIPYFNIIYLDEVQPNDLIYNKFIKDNRQTIVSLHT